MTSSYAKNLARKSPPPAMMVALGGDEPETEDNPAEEADDPDEDANQAAAMSAYEDFARLAGFKASPQTFAAFKELVNLIMRPEHRRLHPDDFK